MRVQIKLDYSFVPDVENGKYMCILVVSLKNHVIELSMLKIQSLSENFTIFGRKVQIVRGGYEKLTFSHMGVCIV